MPEFRNLGQFLKAKRVSSQWTQGGLAAELGSIHSQFVSNWERGLCAPPNHCFQKLITCLKIDRKELVRVMLMDAKAEIESKVLKKKSAKGRS